MEIAAVVGLCIVFFLLGRAYQKWSSGILDVEDAIYEEGYDEGHSEGYREGFGVGQQQGWQLAQHQNRR